MGTKPDNGDEIEVKAQLRKMLAAAGLRTTAARIAVLRWLQQSKAPASHADIASELAPLGIDKATVFRNLTDLVDAGFVTRSELGDRVWRFELRDAHHSAAHPHFVCVDCGKIICLQDVDLPATAKRALSTVGHVTEVLVRGHCIACS